MNTAALLGWIGSALGIVGALLNARQQRAGFIFYTIANVILIVVGVCNQEWYNVTLFSVFSAISVYGYVAWGRKTGTKA